MQRASLRKRDPRGGVKVALFYGDDVLDDFLGDVVNLFSSFLVTILFSFSHVDSKNGFEFRSRPLEFFYILSPLTLLEKIPLWITWMFWMLREGTVLGSKPTPVSQYITTRFTVISFLLLLTCIFELNCGHTQLLYFHQSYHPAVVVVVI